MSATHDKENVMKKLTLEDLTVVIGGAQESVDETKGPSTQEADGDNINLTNEPELGTQFNVTNEADGQNA
jgi:hypothetical protein